MKAFLSSTYLDLRKHRKAAKEAIERLGYQVGRMEVFGARPAEPCETCLADIDDCDLFVGIYAHRYGFVPDGSDVSITEAEFDHAKAKGKPRFCFLIHEDHPWSPKMIEQEPGASKLRAFKEKIRAELVCDTFTSPRDVAYKIAASLGRYLAEFAANAYAPVAAIDYVACVILCGGYAERLRPLTYDISKVTLPIGGQPVLARVIALVQQSKRIDRIVLSVNEKYSGQVSSLVTHRFPDSAKLIDSITDPQTEPGEKAGPIGAIQNILSRGDYRDLLVIGGDNLFEFAIDDFLAFASRRHGSSNAVYSFPSYEDASEYGVAHLGPNDEFLDFREKAMVPTYRDVSTACYLFRNAQLELVTRYIGSGHNPDSLGGFLLWLTENGHPISGYRFKSPWFDIGTREKLLAANMHYLVNSHRGNVSHSELKDPVQLSPSCTIVNSVVGPNVYVGPNARIRDSRVSDSIIMEKALVQNAIVEGSVVGPESEFEGRVSEMICGPGNRFIGNSRNT